MSEWLPYERGQVVRDTRDDFAKLRQAWRVIRARRDEGLAVVNLSGLERSFDSGDVDSSLLDDELAPALPRRPAAGARVGASRRRRG